MTAAAPMISAAAPRRISRRSAAPQTKAHREYLRGEGQEECCYHDGDSVIIDDASGEKYTAGGSPSHVARCHMAQLPEVLYHVGKRLIGLVTSARSVRST